MHVCIGRLILSPSQTCRHRHILVMQSLGDQEIKVFVEAARFWLFGEQVVCWCSNTFTDRHMTVKETS